MAETEDAAQYEGGVEHEGQVVETSHWLKKS